MSRHSKPQAHSEKARESRHARSSSGKARALSQAAAIPSHWTTEPASRLRADKMARAKQLLKDSRYPSEEVVESVARLLARHWQRLGRMGRSTAR